MRLCRPFKRLRTEVDDSEAATDGVPSTSGQETTVLNGRQFLSPLCGRILHTCKASRLQIFGGKVECFNTVLLSRYIREVSSPHQQQRISSKQWTRRRVWRLISITRI